jgi:DNA-binding transcriptional regulator LsrR (DeoR family)
MTKRKPKTGNYDTKDELFQNVHYLYYQESLSIKKIALSTSIHEDTVINILKSSIK